MADNDLKPLEEWDAFEKRVNHLEHEHGRPILTRWHEGGIIAAVAGLVLIGLYRFAIHRYWIYFIGALLLGCGVAAAIISHWVKAGTQVEVKERDRLIKERSTYVRCHHLVGAFPGGTESGEGYCRLYDRKIEDCPYCIYCKSYSHEE